MSMINNHPLALDEKVKALARRIAKDVGGLAKLRTEDKTSLVAAINEIKAISSKIKTDAVTNDELSHYAVKSELSKYATTIELSTAIADLIDGAGDDENTLKELADKITALAQADSGLVSALQEQNFTGEQQKQARENIGITDDQLLTREDVLAIIQESM